MSVIKFPGAQITATMQTQHSGPGNGGSGMEARIASLEMHVQYIRRDLDEVRIDVRDVKHRQERDFRILFRALIVAVLGLAALMAKGFDWI